MDFNTLKDKLKLDKIKLDKFKLDRIVDKLFSGKIDKKDLKQNFLLNVSLLIRHFIVTHKQLVIMILLGIAGSIILIAFYISSHEKKIGEANKWFEGALSYYKRAFVDEELTPEERGQSLGESIKRFQYVVNQFSSTPLKYDSIIYQANAFFELQDYNNALKKYQELIDKKSRYYFADQVLINIGKCNEQLNNIEGAMSAYQTVIDKYSHKPGITQAKFQMARLKELSNKANEAFQDYQNLIKEYPQSVWAQEARRRILFLQTMAKKKPEQSQPPGQPQQQPQQSQQPAQSIDELLK